MTDPLLSPSTTALDPASEIEAARQPVLRRLLRNPTGVAALAFLALVVLAAVFAPLLTSFEPVTSSLTDVLAPPFGRHLLGADGSGQDVLANLLYGSRFSLAGALLATATAAVIGVTAGLVAGYYGGWFDSVSSWLAGLLLALPGIVVLLAARAVLGPSLWVSMSIFGVLLAPAFYRLVYASVVAIRHELYVDAARVSGVRDLSIVTRHILTVVRAPIIIQAASVMGIAIAIQAGLDFLGLGNSSTPAWGTTLNSAFAQLYRAPLLIVWPSLLIALASIALALLANALRDELGRGSRRTPKAAAAGATRMPPPAAPMEHPAEDAFEASSVVLQIDDLSVGYDQPDGTVKQVVNGVSLTVRTGEVHGLIGESGSGKTQTAWSVLRLLPTGGRLLSGSISFAGTDLSTLSGARMTGLRGHRIGYIPQEPMSNLDPSFTIGFQLVQPIRLHLGLSRSETKARVLDLLARVGIRDPERTFAAYPHEVSGGMAQRVLIAGAISCDPELLIADEPTTALDVTVQADILDLLRDLQRELGLSVLLVTHNFGVVADLCDSVSVMQNGSIVEHGPVRALFADPQHPYTRSLFAAVLEDGAARGALEWAADRHTLLEGTS